MSRLFIGLVLFFAFVKPTAGAEKKFLLDQPRRIVFLGDSNTFAGTFIAFLDAHLRTRYPDRTYELINLGLPSETVSGLSEPDHPYPRPDIHTRLDRALELSKPELVVACYGMNDGIYSPFSEERFKKYQEGIWLLIDKVKKAGAKIVLMTPAPFDPLPVMNKLLPAAAPKHSWMRPYEKYDAEVLTRYSEWLVSLRKEGFIVCDPHTAILRHLEKSRSENPDYRVSGDGIHPNEDGHRIIAGELLVAMNARGPIDTLQYGKAPANAAFWKLVKERERILGLAWLTHVGHKRPDTPKGLQMEEAKKKANELEGKIRALSKAASD